MNRIGRQNPILHRRPGWGAAFAATSALLAGLSSAHAAEFDVAGGELRHALDTYIAQSGVQLIYKVEDVRALSTRGVKGQMAPDAALDRLLDGTRLRVRRGRDGAMVLIAQQPGAADRKR
jgi:hypothetical protein